MGISWNFLSQDTAGLAKEKEELVMSQVIQLGLQRISASSDLFLPKNTPALRPGTVAPQFFLDSELWCFVVLVV